MGMGFKLHLCNKNHSEKYSGFLLMGTTMSSKSPLSGQKKQLFIKVEDLILRLTWPHNRVGLRVVSRVVSQKLRSI